MKALNQACMHIWCLILRNCIWHASRLYLIVPDADSAHNLCSMVLLCGESMFGQARAFLARRITFTNN